MKNSDGESNKTTLTSGEASDQERQRLFVGLEVVRESSLSGILVLRCTGDTRQRKERRREDRFTAEQQVLGLVLGTCFAIGRAVDRIETVNRWDDHVFGIDGPQTVSTVGARLLQVVIEHGNHGFFL
jgi:hypothetical protein